MWIWTVNLDALAFIPPLLQHVGRVVEQTQINSHLSVAVRMIELKVSGPAITVFRSTL